MNTQDTPLLVISSRTQGMNLHNGMKNHLGSEFRLITLGSSALEALPDQSMMYEPVEAVLWGDIRPDALRPAQIQALQEWVRSGGKLIVWGGVSGDQLRGSWLESLLPVQLKNQEVLTSPQFSTWQSAGDFLHFLLSVTRIETPHPSLIWRQMKQFSWDPVRRGQTSGLHDSLQRSHLLRPPSLRFVILFLFAYIMTISPVNYLFLRHKKRLELTWLTIPTIVLAFLTADFCNKIGIIEKGELLLSGDVQKISEKILGERTFLITLRSGMEQAAETLLATPGISGVTLENSTLRISVTAEIQDAGDIIRLLEERGFAVTGCSEESTNHEEIFMKITQGLVA